jgi:hypothetical protein
MCDLRHGRRVRSGTASAGMRPPALSVALAAILLAPLSARADPAANPPAKNVFAIELWGAPRGVGVARTIGPMTSDECTKTVANMKAHPPDMPPSLIQMIRPQCVFSGSVPGALAGFNCQPGESRDLPKYPGRKVWTYSCYLP